MPWYLEDTTQFEAPDTPAPVFAARAFKNALFGAPNASETPAAVVKTDQHRNETSKKTSNDTQSKDMFSPIKQSPTKQPASILLTPGTGTARRKRVSFNHDVKAGSNPDSSPLASARTRKRTTLQKALDKTRRIAKPEKSPEKAPERAREQLPPNPAEVESEGEWEDDMCNHDMTVDLNEPHSESGKYWKSEFMKYREDAMVDIERMVKFKALAKSYAKKKDAEALELAQALKEEKTKVTKMEQEVTTMAAKIAHKKRHGGGDEDGPLMEDLAKQTSLAAHYREQVRELETILKDKDKSAANRSDRYRINTSPKTEQAIFEANRELRRARSELKEMDKLRQENKKLKSTLKQVTDAQEDTVAAYKAQIKELESELRETRDLSREKDRDLRKKKRDYEALKRDAKSRTAEAMQVLQIKNDKIAELENTIKTLETVSPSTKATQDLKASIESLGKPSKFEGAKPPERLSRMTSAENLTLQKFSKSIFQDSDDSTGPQLDMSTSILPPHWSSSFKDMRSQLVKEKEELMEANKRERELIMEDSEMPRSAAKNRASLPTFDSGRAMSQVLTNRLNKPSQDNQVSSSPRSGKEILEEKLAEERARIAANRVSEDAVMHGALQPASRPDRPRSYSGRPLSDSNAPSPLSPARERLASRSSRVPEGSKSMNTTSRSILPEDRLAAARARLEQKKLERKNGSRRTRDKENVRP